jgi:hypothetical protein
VLACAGAARRAPGPVQRRFAQITRVLEISGLRIISREVVETARESLVIGTL